MAITGWYYLHTNGDLIYKRDTPGQAADIRDSDFARALWPVDPDDREGAWTILVEALAAGANPSPVHALAEKWHCTNDDAKSYAERLRVDLGQIGASEWRAAVGSLAADRWTAGYGPCALEALAELAKRFGYRPAKMWGASFKDLLKGPKS